MVILLAIPFGSQTRVESKPLKITSSMITDVLEFNNIIIILQISNINKVKVSQILPNSKGNW